MGVIGAQVWIALLSGCMSDPVRYMEPDAGPRARIRFVAQTAYPTDVRAYGNPECTVEDLKVASLGEHIIPQTGWGRSTGIPLGEAYQKSATTEVYIRAGRPFPIRFSSPQPVSCVVSASFDPVENAMYEAVFILERKSCRFEMYRIAWGEGEAPRKIKEPARRLAYCTVTR